MASKKQRSGIIIYFEFASVFKRMQPQQVYELVIAALEYGETGAEPQIEDPIAAIVWPLMREKIDADEKRYADACVRNSYNAYCRWAKEKGETPLPFEEWYATVYESCQLNQTKLNQTKLNQTKLNQTKNKLSEKGEGGTEGGAGGNPPVDLHAVVGGLCAPMERGYSPPDSSEWNRLKNEKTARLREALRE